MRHTVPTGARRPARQSIAGRLDRAEWFRQLHELGPVAGVSGSDAVAAARDELP